MSQAVGFEMRFRHDKEILKALSGVCKDQTALDGLAVSRAEKGVMLVLGDVYPRR